MTNGADNLPERVQAIEEKLIALASSVDRRFDQVDAAIVEQRAYTEFAYETLDSTMSAGFATLDRKMDAGFATLDRKMDAGSATLDRKMDAGFATLDRKMDAGFVTLDRKMDAGFAKVDGRFARLESKIDQIIDPQMPKPPMGGSDEE